ncbi:putative CtpA-like serine protease [Bythopirellula polymerisocia]|uniref:Putative CtpA-like serine protease n=2 Tax=Bythopirellula polymerisocia TaxID=2528003 RepID=A0A5C6D1N8_9BACT|nr:putative CtpA-like serine protease [Bythopirellula polymerisocia]
MQIRHNLELQNLEIHPSKESTESRGNWSRRMAATLVAVFFFAGSLLVSPATAQVSRGGEPVTIVPKALPANSISSVLDRGRQLETNRRWGEALSHYEDALREHRDNETLQQHHDLAKLHYSVERRYHDHSFLQSISTLNRDQALSLYAELLQKTNSHYVANPPWRKLSVRGASAIDLALTDPGFLAANNVQLSSDQLAQLRKEIYQLLGQRSLQSSRDLITFATEVSRLAEVRAGLTPTATVLEFVTAAAEGLDDYSSFLTADQLRETYSQIEGNFVGLGVELKAENGALLIVRVIPGSPAERAGILDQDRIVAVDGKSTAELSTDEAASMLTGVEGSFVRVTVYSPSKEPRVLNIRREHVNVPSLENPKIVDTDFGIAYVRVPAFQKTTSRDLETALWDLHRQGMRSLILDLRGNPGGLLTASVELADKFLTEGNIVSTRGRSPQEDFNYTAHYGGTWRVPLVVLIDGDSASASEIFAAAIKDNNRGTIVGSTSFGKGSVQGIFPLGFAGAGIRLTTAKFYSPNGTPISYRGVEPHEKVQVVAKPVLERIDLANQEKSDLVLQAGIQAARSRLATPVARPSTVR